MAGNMLNSNFKQRNELELEHPTPESQSDVLSCQLADKSPSDTGYQHIRVKHGRQENALEIAFWRTSRVLNNPKGSATPLETGTFPLYVVDDYKKTLPAAMSAKGGCFLPINDGETMCIRFKSKRPFAVKVLVGGVSTMRRCYSAKITSSGQSLQDYTVINPGAAFQQPIHGCHTSDKKVVQFTAVSTNNKHSIEARVNGSDKVGGIQIVVTPIKAGDPISYLNVLPLKSRKTYVYKNFDSNDTVYELMRRIQNFTKIPTEQLLLIYNHQRLDSERLLSHYNIKSDDTIHQVLRITGGGLVEGTAEMALRGGRYISQPEIVKDLHADDSWDVEETIMINVQLLNATLFCTKTGTIIPPAQESAPASFAQPDGVVSAFSFPAAIFPQLDGQIFNLPGATSATIATEYARDEQSPGTFRVLPNGRIVVSSSTSMPPPQVHRTPCISWLDTVLEKAEKAEKEQIQDHAIPAMSLKDGLLRCPEASCKEHPGFKTTNEAFNHEREKHEVDLKHLEARWEFVESGAGTDFSIPIREKCNSWSEVAQSAQTPILSPRDIERYAAAKKKLLRATCSSWGPDGGPSLLPLKYQGKAGSEPDNANSGDITIGIDSMIARPPATFQENGRERGCLSATCYNPQIPRIPRTERRPTSQMVTAIRNLAAVREELLRTHRPSLGLYAVRSSLTTKAPPGNSHRIKLLHPDSDREARTNAQKYARRNAVPELKGVREVMEQVSGEANLDVVKKVLSGWDVENEKQREESFYKNVYGDEESDGEANKFIGVPGPCGCGDDMYCAC